MIHLTAYRKFLVRFTACGTDSISLERKNPRRFIIIIIGILVVTWVWSSYLSSLVFTLFGGVLDQGSICLALQVRCTP